MVSAGGQPNYFTINGRAYPSTDTIRMKVGEPLRVRFIGTNVPLVAADHAAATFWHRSMSHLRNEYRLRGGARAARGAVSSSQWIGLRRLPICLFTTRRTKPWPFWGGPSIGC
ncbi:MAG: hypothetical protein E5Y56_22815, partial [Mesorhizobium sp.]